MTKDWKLVIPTMSSDYNISEVLYFRQRQSQSYVQTLHGPEEEYLFIFEVLKDKPEKSLVGSSFRGCEKNPGGRKENKPISFMLTFN